MPVCRLYWHHSPRDPSKAASTSVGIVAKIASLLTQARIRSPSAAANFAMGRGGQLRAAVSVGVQRCSTFLTIFLAAAKLRDRGMRLAWQSKLCLRRLRTEGLFMHIIGMIVAIFIFIMVLPNILAALFGLASSLAALAALPVILAFKSGLISRGLFRKGRQASFYDVCGVSLAITAVVGLGAFAFLSHCLSYPEVATALKNKNNINFKLNVNGLWEELGNLWQEGWMYRDAKAAGRPVDSARFVFSKSTEGLWLFYLSTVALIYSQKLQSQYSKIFYVLMISVIGIVCYALVIHGEGVLDKIVNHAPLTAAKQLLEGIIDEVKSFVELMKIITGNETKKTFASWLTGEVVKMNGSIYKVGALYPKFFLFLVAFNIWKPNSD